MSQSPIFTAIDIGTSKVIVLMATIDANEKIKVIGYGERALKTESQAIGAVVKGEIVDMEALYKYVEEAFSEAESSSGYAVDRFNTFLSITGGHIHSTVGHGIAHICSPDHLITEEVVRDALSGVENIKLSNTVTAINTVDSYYLLGAGNRRVTNPEGMSADKLEAILHIICGDANRVQTTRAALHQMGYDEDVELVFSGLANFYILRDEERESGVISLDFGAGTTEYIVTHGGNVQASGVIPVGIDHIANDLVVAFDLPFGDAMKIVKNGSLFSTENPAQILLSIECEHRGSRKIPLHEIESIIDARLTELFDMIHERLKMEFKTQILRYPIVLSGGGAKSPYVVHFVKKIFNAPVRVSNQLVQGEYARNLQDPAYATVVGLLNYALLYSRLSSEQSIGTKVSSILDRKLNALVNHVSKIFK